MVEADARLGVVKKTGMNGKAEVSRYFGNSSTVGDCRAGWWKDTRHPGVRSQYFVLLKWSASKVAEIRDFRRAPYIIDGAEYLI